MHDLRIQTQRQCIIQFYSGVANEKPDRKGGKARQFGILQPSLLSSKTRELLEASHRPKLTQPVLNVPKFRMETPESIRSSLKKGEWVTSIDLTDAYLHVPIHPQSRKFLRFHYRGTSYQFSSLPFVLATAPLVFTSLVKEVKLMALQLDIRLHQYLDNWLIRVPCQAQALLNINRLLTLIHDLGFLVNTKKSELTPTQRFDFIEYHFLLDKALVGPTQVRWTKIQVTFHRTAKTYVISARTLMSIIGLLASTEKTVKLGSIHMGPFQWHLKIHWRFPMPLNSPIPWTQRMKQHREWWLNPHNVLQGEFLILQTPQTQVGAPTKNKTPQMVSGLKNKKAYT